MTENRSIDKFTWVLIVVSLTAGLFGSVLFTELGQLLNLPSDWLYKVYPHLGWVSVLVALCALYVLFQHFKNGILSRKMAIAYVVVVAGMIFVTNYFVPEVWLRGHHYTAQYVSVAEADTLLDKRSGCVCAGNRWRG